jgi:hypothetical protein
MAELSPAQRALLRVAGAPTTRLKEKLVNQALSIFSKALGGKSEAGASKPAAPRRVRAAPGPCTASPL